MNDAEQRVAGPGEIVRGPALASWPEQTVGALIAARAARFGDKEALRFRAPSGQWRSLSFSELDKRRRAIAAGLIAQGVRPGDRVLLLSPNSAPMLLSELAIVSIGAVSTPVFPDYPLEFLRHCLRDSGARVAMCGSPALQRRLAEVSGGQLERLIALDDQPLEGDGRAIALEAIERRGEALPPTPADAELGADERAFLLYTSGTTGRPKGVPLTHRNVLSQQAAVARSWSLSSDDVFLSYLPWHHCFGSLFERLMAFWHGALLVLDDSRGRDLERLLANFREIKPTLYFSAPRVYQALVARAESDPEARRALLHPKLRFVFTAAAPLPAGCYQFFESAGVPVHEGWGLTESSPCATLTGERTRRSGLVGWPLPGTEVLLEPVEQSSDPSVGELLIRGPQVMSGYHGDPASTRAVLRADGFLRTGDLGSWSEHGLRIRGRVDGVFKLQNGEKVASGEVEARLLAATPLLEQALVLGPGQPFATALAWLNPIAARAFVEGQQLVPEGRTASTLATAELLAIPELRRAITEALQASNLLAPLPYERLRRVLLAEEPLSLERGELTPTQKLIRSTVIAQHREEIEALRSGEPHPRVLELYRKLEPFQLA